MPVDRLVTEGKAAADARAAAANKMAIESDGKPQWMKELIMKRAFSKSFPVSADKSSSRVAASGGPLRSATQEDGGGEKACLKGVHLSATRSTAADGSVNAPNLQSAASFGRQPSELESVGFGGSTPAAVHGGTPAQSADSTGAGTLRTRPVVVDGEVDVVCQRRSTAYAAMGEDKSSGVCLEKSVEAGSESSGRQQEIAQHDVTSSEEPIVANTDEEDEEEMLEYGPGIVDKLRSKFLSISLKQEREVKRSASLENLLETDKLFQATDSTLRERTIVAGNRANGYLLQSPSNLKKAKSMETLFFEPQKRWNAGRLPARAGRRIAPLRRHPSVPDHLASAAINENIVIIENLPPKSETDADNRSVTSSLVKRRDYHRQPSNISDDELPKPDIVKTYKRIFESADKKQASQTSLKRRPPVVRASAKSCSAHSKPASLQRNSAVPSAPPEARVNGIQAKASAIKPPVVNGEAMHHPKPVVSKENMAPVENGDTSVSTVVIQEDTDTLGKGMKSISQDSLARIRSHGLTMTFGAVVNAAGSKTLPLASQDVNKTPKTTDVPVVTSSLKKPATVSPTKTTLPPPPPPPTFVQKQQEPLSKPSPFPPRQDKKPIANIKPIPKEIEPLPVEAVEKETINDIKPAVVPQLPTPTIEQEVKPSIIIEPKLEDDDDSESDDNIGENDVLKPSTLLGNRKPFWQKPPQPTTSIVFDFRGKDVKPNIAVQPTPFGCKPAPVHRKKKRTNTSRLVDGKESPPSGIVNGDATDSCGSDNPDDDDDEDSDDMDPSSLAPPGPCGIVFEGENVIIGSGALLVTRNKKLRIQFREKLTSTFEYPSESSYIDDLLSPPSPAPLDSRLTNGDDGSISQEPQSDDTSPLFLPSATLKSTPALGSSGGLASYTPSMLTSTEGFQLGVSRCIRDDVSPPSQQQAQKSDSLKPEEEGKEEMLKPANPEDTSSWSSSTDTSDLLF